VEEVRFAIQWQPGAAGRHPLLHAQFIIATHSPILMAYPEANIYALGPDGIERTTYRETEHYKLTRSFLEDPERYLHYLFA
jgi:predicted ATPase